MGFRSNFIMGYTPVAVPKWFIDKYDDFEYFEDDGIKSFPIALLGERKFYVHLKDTEIFIDIQKVLLESKDDCEIIVVLLHECGGITRVSITKDEITGQEPTKWNMVEAVEHNYCYGCSDVNNTK